MVLFLLSFLSFVWLFYIEWLSSVLFLLVHLAVLIQVPTHSTDNAVISPTIYQAQYHVVGSTEVIRTDTAHSRVSSIKHLIFFSETIFYNSGTFIRFLFINSILYEVLKRIFIFLKVLIANTLKLFILNFSISWSVALFLLFVSFWDFVYFFLSLKDVWYFFFNWIPDIEYKDLKSLYHVIIFFPGRQFE